MKIKAVCAQTGLTDRTIRYYIEQGLIDPAYEENYTGRRTYDFLERDIAQLQDIAVLRKFDFTIEEIRSILNDAQASRTVIAAVRERTEATARQCREKLAALEQIDAGKTYTLPELAQELSRPSQTLPVPNENGPSGFWKALGSAVIGAIVWAPLVLSIVAMMDDIRCYRYPVFEPAAIGLTLLALLPSAAVLATAKIKFRRRKLIRGVLLGLCVLSIPISVFFTYGIVLRSVTTDFCHYRDLDADCLANRNKVFQELFPDWPRYFENVRQEDGSWETVYLDAEYYYHYYSGLDDTYDIFAQWPLEEEEYRQEIQRVRDLFNEAVEKKTYAYSFVEVRKGGYDCLILYRGDEPFTPVDNSYDYLIFAYNDALQTVRYICCDSLEDGADQPYYLSLEW